MNATPILPTPPSPPRLSPPDSSSINTSDNAIKKTKTKKSSKKSTKKRLVTFGNIHVFDKKFKADIETCFSVVAKMLFAKKIGVDGSVDVNNVVNLRKYELWSYIYYLYYYNHTSIDEFASMKSTGNFGGASAENFYKTVRDVVNNKYVDSMSVGIGSPDNIIPFDIQTLCYFLNYMIHKYEDDLKNPIIDYLKEILRAKDPVSKLNSLIVKMTPNAKNAVKIIPGTLNAKGSQNADVKIDIKTI